jgi:hypothetical protein
MVFALTGYGLVAGWAIARVVVNRWRAAGTLATLAGAIAAGAFVLFAMATLGPGVQSLASDTRARATAWDRQDERIRAEIAGGATEVTYQPLYIGGLAEPFFTRTYSRDWVASCAATYYGVAKLNPLGPTG